MYNRLASNIAKVMLDNKTIDSSKIDIYIYGIELIIAYLCYFVVLILNAILTKTILETVFFCLGFMLLRRFAGGYHTSTYLKCQLLFVANQYLFVVLIKTITIEVYNYVLVFILGFSVLSIWIFAPIDHENRRFNQKERVHFQRISRVYSLVVVIVAVILFKFSQLLTLSYLIGVFSASCSIIAGYIQQKKIKQIA